MQKHATQSCSSERFRIQAKVERTTSAGCRQQSPKCVIDVMSGLSFAAPAVQNQLHQAPLDFDMLLQTPRQRLVSLGNISPQGPLLLLEKWAYIYAHTHIFVYVSIHIYIKKWIHTYIHPSIHPSIHPCMHACTCARTNTDIYTQGTYITAQLQMLSSNSPNAQHVDLLLAFRTACKGTKSKLAAEALAQA